MNLWRMFLLLDWLERVAVGLAVVAAVFSLTSGNIFSLLFAAPSLIVFYRYMKLKAYFGVHAADARREAEGRVVNAVQQQEPEPPQQLGTWGQDGPPRRSR